MNGRQSRALIHAAEYVPEHTATYRLDRHVAEARKAMGEDRWRELNAEWTR